MIKKIILTALITSSILNADLIKEENIDPNKAAIQVASVKNESSVKNVVKKYSQFDTYIKDLGEWKKIYIVNIPMQNRYNDLKSLKSIDKNIFFINIKYVVDEKKVFSLEKEEENLTTPAVKDLKEETLTTPIVKKTPIEQTPKTIFIKSYKFVKNTAIDSKDLQTIAKEYENKNLTMQELIELTDKITNYYKDNGYFIATAYIPKQNMQDGILEISLAEGKYGEFKVDNNSSVDSDVIKNFLNKEDEHKIISNTTLKKKMDRLKVLSGLEVTNTQLTASKEPEGVDFVVSTGDTKKFNSYISADNYGNRYTGEYNIALGTNINNLSGIGDSLSLNASLSDSAKSKVLSGNYNRHLGYSGITGGVNFLFSKYEFENIPNYETVGDTSSAGLFINYPLEANSIYSRSLSAAYNFSKVKSDSGLPGYTQLSDKELNSLQLSFIDQRLLQTALPSSLTTNLSVTIGDLKMASDLAKSNDTYLDSEGTFSKINVDLNYGVSLSDLLTLQAKLLGQKSLGKNLDASQDFVASGSNAVRAYENAELNGDNGYFASMELFYKLPNINSVMHKISLFLDHSSVWINTKKFNTEDNTRSLNAIGLGYALNYLDFMIKASYAHGFGSDSTPISEAEYSTSKDKFLVQTNYNF